MKRGSVSGPSHHVDRPVLRELNQIAMNEATTNSQVTNKNRPHDCVSCPARIDRGGNAVVNGAARGGGGGGIVNGGAKEGSGGFGSISL